MEMEWNPLGICCLGRPQNEGRGQMFFIREEGTNCVLGGKGGEQITAPAEAFPPSKESNFVLKEVGGRNE